MQKRVTVVGAGHVGATLVQRIAETRLADVVMVDVVEGVPQGKGLDLLEAGPVLGYDSKVTGTNGYDETAGSDIIVITAGLARKPGMSRDDLLAANGDVVKKVAQETGRRSPNAIMIVVTNPMDVMAYVAMKASGFPRERVVGMGGVLDSARFRTFIAMELGVSVENTHAFVLGGHGDSMVPLPRYSTVAGIPITEIMSAEQISRLVERTRNGGAEIVALLKTGSAYYAPSAATLEMVEAMLLDKKKILPCSAYLEGEYGVQGAFAGVPVKLGAKGVEQVVEITLSADENAAFMKSVDAVRAGCAKFM
ncbi:MAG TPA: malate dehydrogenase [Nitrospirota bacterium]|nr:malate dehydrogenase [Nitrospirota bacterium]